MVWLAALAISCAGSKPPPSPLKLAPLAYYAAKCARCHGPEGSYYPDHFATQKTDKQLWEVLDRMARGAGQAPIQGIDLDVQVAFHRAIDRQLPFIAWTKIQGATLSGETTTDQLEAKIGSKNLPISVKDEAWTLTIPNGDKANSVVIFGKNENGACVLKLAESPMSAPVKAQKPHSTL